MTKSFATRLVSAVMALLMIFIAFASFGAIKAQADIGYVPAPYSDGVIDIYYLFDYYPEIGNTKMANEQPDIDIIYDRCANIENTLINIAAGSYLSNDILPSGATVVIDIKTYQPESALLAAAFGYIKNSLHCKVMFVTVYNEPDFADDDPQNSLFDYVDDFYTSDHRRLEAFCKFSQIHIKENNGTLEDTCILIDGNVVDFNDMFGNYSFLRILIDRLWVATAEYCPEHSNSGYMPMISHLKYDHNISLLVNTFGFEDLANRLTHVPSNSAHPHGEELSYNHIYAIGFYKLDQSFSNYLYQNYINLTEIPQYLLEADPFVPNENGVPVILDYYLEQMYNDGTYELDDFMDRLMAVVES